MRRKRTHIGTMVERLDTLNWPWFWNSAPNPYYDIQY